MEFILCAKPMLMLAPRSHALHTLARVIRVGHPGDDIWLSAWSNEVNKFQGMSIGDQFEASVSIHQYNGKVFYQGAPLRDENGEVFVRRTGYTAYNVVHTTCNLKAAEAREFLTGRGEYYGT